MNRLIYILFISLGLASCKESAVQQWTVFEYSLKTTKKYNNPFTDVEVNVVFEHEDKRWVVPAFWEGDNKWSVRFAPSFTGEFSYYPESSDTANPDFNRKEQRFNVIPYKGDNPLLQHGFLHISENKRFFEHADGTPFLWLGDTWWKNLCKRMTWEGFQELTADRKAKGFNVVQIVCGPYPDENMMEERWENEGGMPYEKIDFSVMNPKYYEYADRRIKHLVDNGIVPVIVGGWGRPQGGGQSTLVQVGLEGFKRHWRNIIARYGAYPVIWMVGGEVKDVYGPWSELAEYLKVTDPYKHMLCYHAPGNPRKELEDNSMFDFDMLAIGHNGMETVNRTFDLMRFCFEASPKRPVLCGEACYEGHMQTNFQYIQRFMFWSFMLSGAAGHSYGAAGIWHAGVEGDPGHTGYWGQEYDWTTWKEGMNYPGSTQLGIGKRLLEKYPWSNFKPHPEWVEEGCFAAGIPGEIRIVYLPRRDIYNWSGPAVKNLDPSVNWHVYYFDPATGRKFDQGIIKASIKLGNEVPHPVDFKRNVPSPQDWVLVLEKIE
ncbi:MAG: DUF4038 domain-containing protein [Bacteroidetes bacterium]|nr:MAG: DUF4038 domain-containing protein [Bacteroidota bacterium]